MNSGQGNTHTVLIIGAGPAGTAAAKTLSQAGISVAIIDKYIFPRKKLCGGLLTGRSKCIFESIFDSDCWSKVVNYTSTGCKFYSNLSQINKVNNYSKLYFTDRCNFDNILLESAVKSGTKTYLGSQVIKIDNITRTIFLQDSTVIKYTFLIGADGVNSVVSKYLFGRSYNTKKIALGLEIDIKRDEAKDENIIVPEIFFGLVNWGYAWVFPKKDTLTIGIGGLTIKNNNLSKVFLKNFIKKRFNVEISDKKIKGHHIPFGDFRSIPGKKNILLCGDAAGLVEPITGEGIAFAMESGNMCGISIIEAIKINTDDALNFYKTKYKNITKILLYSKVLRYFIFNPLLSKIFLKKLSKPSSSLPNKFLDLMENKITYKELIQSSIKKKILKFIFFWKKYE